MMRESRAFGLAQLHSFAAAWDAHRTALHIVSDTKTSIERRLAVRVGFDGYKVQADLERAAGDFPAPATVRPAHGELSLPLRGLCGDMSCSNRIRACLAVQPTEAAQRLRER